jgi:hypothetical protein
MERPMNPLQTLRSATLAGLLLLPVPERLAACAFHTVLPEATVSQQIAGAIEVIAARPAADNPFRFEPVAVLKGAVSASHPPHLVDSATRARLARHPGDAVLFAREVDGSWTRLLVLDAATWPVVDLMIARAGEWKTPEGAAERRDTFADLLAHPDARIRNLALRELDALPYGALRHGTYPVAAAELLRGIADIQDMPLAPIRVLLLGLVGGSAADEAITGRLASLAASGAHVLLGAWITAAMESGGPDGVAEVERVLLTSAGHLSYAQLVEIVRSFSLQSAEGDTTLSMSIDSSLRRLVSLRPDAAPLVVQAFGAAEDYSQAPLIRELLAARAFTDLAGLMVALAYIDRAQVTGGAVDASARKEQAGALK